MINQNNVITKLCIACNKERPLDYFVGEERICWACKSKHLGEDDEDHIPAEVLSERCSAARKLDEAKKQQEHQEPFAWSENAIELVRLASTSIERRYCIRNCRYYASKRAYKCDKFQPKEDCGCISCYGFMK